VVDAHRKAEAPGSTPRDYMAEGHAYTAIDTSELVVVAFVQEGPYRAPKPNPAAAAAAPAGNTATVVAGAAPAPAPTAPRNAADAALANILNAAKTDVVFTPAPKAKGGDK
jgi:hypothetical protein